jgi:hypothetical protein
MFRNIQIHFKKDRKMVNRKTLLEKISRKNALIVIEISISLLCKDI